MIQVAHLFFSYGTHRVLADISFSVQRGELLGLFGPNGSGKTTLFRNLMGFLSPAQGSVLIEGVDVHQVGAERLAKLAAYVPQEHRPPFPYSVLDIVLMGRTPHLHASFIRVPRAEKLKALEMIERVGLEGQAERPFTELSGGQRQLVLIARALAQETQALFLDEPTSALDFENQLRVWSLLRSIANRGVMVIACTHDPNHIAWYCDRAIVLNRQGGYREGSVSEIMTEETLNGVYNDLCQVNQIGGTKVVLPKRIPAL